MRILVVTPSFLPTMGGAERLIYEVYHRLARRHTVRVLAAEPPRGAVLASHSMPFEVEHYATGWRWDRLRGRRLHRGFPPPFTRGAARATQSAIRTFGPDVVHVFYAIPTGLAVSRAQRLAIPSVLSLVGRDVPGPGVPVGWRAWVRWVVRRATRVTYISRHCRSALFGEREGPGCIIPGGVDVARFRPAPASAAAWTRRSVSMPDEGPIVLAVQRLARYKGVDDLLRVIAALPEGSLVIAGWGPEERRLKRMAHGLGLDGRVTFLNGLPDQRLPDAYAGADVFVCASQFETFGLAVAEAMASGVPTVAYDSGGLSEVVEHGRTGLLVKPGDWAAMAASIVRLLGDPAARAAMAVAARERAMSLYDWNVVARQYEAVLARAAVEGP
jgi:glycosyltransferase involved in cell wall biosynthesis